jgi:hypothetical protein
MSIMRNTVFLIAFWGLLNGANAQYVYTIKADSVKLTNCDSAELIIENHTQNVPGFLVNTGHGRTVFKRGVYKLNDTLYQIGGDSLTVPKPNLNFWSLSGNSNIDTTSQFFGTNDNNPIIFHGGGYERMRMFPNGNLGIGQSVDNGFKLQVNGGTFGLYASGSNHLIGNLAITSGSDAGELGLSAGIRLDAGYNSLMFEGTNQGWAADMFTFTTAYGNFTKPLYNVDGSIIKVNSAFVDANVPNLSGNVHSLNPTFDLDSDTWPMTLRGIYYNPVIGDLRGSRHISIETVTGDALFGTSSGNMGIGTSAPSAQLHTTGTVRFAGLTSDTSKTRVLVSDADGNLFYRDASSLASNDPIRSSLALNGTFTAQRLRISQTGWPDYVFDSSYQLLPMDQLEKYIKQNNHLPGISSAAEVERQGVDVGNNQAALLKKVEELTLYVIQQKKVLEAQKEAARSQNDEIKSLKEEMEKLRRLISNSVQK